jgi:hypothetical protein
VWSEGLPSLIGPDRGIFIWDGRMKRGQQQQQIPSSLFRVCVPGSELTQFTLHPLAIRDWETVDITDLVNKGLLSLHALPCSVKRTKDDDEDDENDVPPSKVHRSDAENCPMDLN